MKFIFMQDIMVGCFEDFYKAKVGFVSGFTQGSLMNTLIRELAKIGDSFGALTLLISSIFQAFF